MAAVKAHSDYTLDVSLQNNIGAVYHNIVRKSCRGNVSQVSALAIPLCIPSPRFGLFKAQFKKKGSHSTLS